MNRHFSRGLDPNGQQACKHVLKPFKLSGNYELKLQ